MQSLAQDLAVRIVRPAVIYGPRDDNTLPLYRAGARGLFPIPSPPGSTLSTVYATDCAQAVVAALRANGAAPAVVQIANGRRICGRSSATPSPPPSASARCAHCGRPRG